MEFRNFIFGCIWIDLSNNKINLGLIFEALLQEAHARQIDFWSINYIMRHIDFNFEVIFLIMINIICLILIIFIIWS